MIRSFDPMYAAIAYNIVTATDGTALIDAGVQGERIAVDDAPAWRVLRV